MKFNVKISLLIIIITLISFQCETSLGYKDLDSEQSLSIVVSLSMIGDWVRNIIGTNDNVTSIVGGLEDPHTYDPELSEIAAIAGADLFIRFGLQGIEPWVQSVLDSNPGLKEKTLTLINTTVNEYMEYDSLLDTMNPHVWMSPIKVRDMCKKIFQKLSQLNPENNATYYGNFINYQTNLFDLLIRMDKSKSILNGIKVVVNHPSFKYFFDLLSIERLGAIEEREGSEPSAAHIAEITELIKSEDIDKILLINQPQLDAEDVLGIAEETGVKVVLMTPLLGVQVEPSLQVLFGDFIDTYIEMLDYNLRKLTEALEADSTTNTTNGFLSGFEFYTFGGLLILIPLLIKKRR